MYEVIDLGEGLNVFLDVSSSCTGFCITQTINKETTLLEAGALWRASTHTDNGHYYKYLQEFMLETISKQHKVENVVVEQFFAGPNKGFGTSVVNEALGCIQAACKYANPNIKYYSIPVSTWRSRLGIKKDKTLKPPACFKVPTKKRVEEILNYKFPEKLIDLHSKRERNLPTDIVDAVGIAVSWLIKEPNNSTSFIIAKDFIKQEVK